MKNQNNYSIKSIIKQAIMEAANSKEDYVYVKNLRTSLKLANQLKLLSEAKEFFTKEKYALALETIDPLISATQRLNEEIVNILKVMNRIEMSGGYDAPDAPAAPAAPAAPVVESLRRSLGYSKQRSRRY